MDDIQLVMKVDTAPVDRAVRVMDNLEAELRDVERAMDKGLITEKQYNAETQRLTQSMDRLKTVAKGSSKDFRAFEKTVYGSGKAMRQKEIAMQQAGYQLQDFIVQVQAGTNPLIAFSQQGSQLAGFFAGPWGAAIGLGIAALGGLGTALLGTRNKAKTFGERMDDLNTSLEDYESISKRLSNGEGLSKEFGNLANQAKEILLALKEIQGISLRKQLGEFGNIGTVSKQSVMERTGSFYGIPTFGQVQRRDVGQVQAAQEFLGATEGTLGENASYAGQYLDLLEQIQKAETFEAQVEPAGRLAAFLRSHVESRGDEVKNLEEITKLQEVLLQITGMQARQDVETSNKRKNILTQIQTDAMAMEAELAEEAKQAATDANTIRTAMSSAYTLQRIADEEKIKEIENDRLKAKSAMDAAALEATAQRADEEYAAYQRSIDQRYEGEKELFNQAVTISDELLKKIEEDADKAARAYENAFNASSFLFANRFADETALMAMDVSPAKTKTKKKSGKTPAQELNDYMKNLERTVKLEQKQVGVSEEVARSLELEEEYKKRGLKVNESRIEALVAEEEALRKATEAEQKRQTMIDSFEGHIENAFMALVDGSKSIEDTFKSMIRSIILDMYQQMVAKQAASFLMGFLPFANGGAFSGGRVTPFASGGVVNRPTLFPMANGAGLMGESGPEAIMPLKRGKDGKLGVEGGGGVTVVQNINVSTGVQQTVRTEIKSLMPQIAESAKSAVVDAKRRGGSYGRVFN